MRRQRFRKPALNVALFPFLAVLVCTMGALIVLLVLVVQQARVAASEVSETADSQRAAEQDRIADWQQQQADSEWRRDMLVEQRAEMRQQLVDSRLQLGHLEDHIRRLESEWAELQTAAAELDRLSAVSDEEQAEATAQRDRLRAELDAARKELEEARREAAEKPRSFAIIPYPGPHGTQRRPIYIECTEQGIILQPEGVVLRADDFSGPLGAGNPLDAALRTVREYLRRLGTTAAVGEPYPLLIVRPDGAVAYNVARMAMKAWDDEFGYELIDGEMELAFPPADPHLKPLLEQSILDARQRQAALAAAMPSQFQDGLLDGFVASPDGGFSVVPSEEGDSSWGAAAASGTAAGGRGMGGRYSEEQAALESQRRNSAAGGSPGTTMASWPRDPSSPPSQGGSAAQPSDGQAASSGRAASRGTNPKRGRDWGLKKPANPGATAVTRPIRVVCQVQRLVIIPEKLSPDPPRVVATPHGPAAAIDQFVAAVWDRVDRWGIAVPGGYWKPTLQVFVDPGAESQFDQLQRALQGSGLELQRD